MIKKLLIISFPGLFLIFSQTVFAQQTNGGEDYSAWLAEVRALNWHLSHTPLSEPESNVKTQLRPAIKQATELGGNFALRIFKPAAVNAVVLEIHGGGWCAGSAALSDSLNDIMARKCKVAVVSVDYRLAPANPFPACVDDCKAAAKWLVANTVKEFGTDKIFISGGSAGAHLAALTTLYIRDSLQAISKVRGVNLMYGVFDLSGTPSCKMVTDSTPVINKEALEGVLKLVFDGWSTDQKRDPRYSPLYADLHNLPPALFTIGTNDPVVDDTYFMEARWRLAGNKTFLALYPECPHAFNEFPIKMGMIANDRIFQWIIEKYK